MLANVNQEQNTGVTEIDSVNGVQILDTAVCISHAANVFGKGMNPTMLSSARDQ